MTFWVRLPGGLVVLATRLTTVRLAGDRTSVSEPSPPALVEEPAVMWPQLISAAPLVTENLIAQGRVRDAVCPLTEVVEMPSKVKPYCGAGDG